MYKKILIASDGSDGAAKAFDAALESARQHGAELTMICVEELPSFSASVDEVAEEKRSMNGLFNRVTGHASAQAKEAGVRFKTHIVAGRSVPCIVDYIKQNGFDLLIVGFMGHSALYDRIIGSTTDRLVELAPCNVLVIK